MIKMPKIDFKSLFQYEQLKALFTKERLLAFFSRENFAHKELLPSLLSDGYLITHLALFAGTIIAIVVWCRAGVGVAQVVTLSLFVYFNAVLAVFLVRHRRQIDWQRIGWSCVAIFLIAVGIFILIYSAFKGWDQLLSSTIAMGIVAAPIMALDSGFRHRMIGSCFSTFGQAVEGCGCGGSVESIFGSILGVFLLGIVLIMVVFAVGTIGAVAFYLGRVTMLLFLSPSLMREGVIDARGSSGGETQEGESPVQELQSSESYDDADVVVVK